MVLIDTSLTPFSSFPWNILAGVSTVSLRWLPSYTSRVAVRHKLIDVDADYEQLRELFQGNLPEDVKLFNEYHALLVRVGKEFCRTKANCSGCPLEGLPHQTEVENL